MQLVKDKKVLITGGTSGLGKAMAIAFAEQGAHVAFCGTNAERAKKVLQMLEEIRVCPEQKFWFKTLDVSNKKSVDRFIEDLIKEWGEIDVLVNNAGVTRDKLFMKMTEEDWDIVLDTNLKSVYNLSHAVIRPMMKARKGKIINICSVIGLIGNPGQVNYAASKLGMVGLTRSLAREVGSRNITINCIAPGFFKTRMTDMLNEQQKENILQKIPMGRLGDPTEIANAALFLASDMSNYISGQVLAVDGGMIA